MNTQAKRVPLLFLFLAYSLQTTPLQGSEILNAFSDSFFSWIKEKGTMPAVYLGTAVFGLIYLWTKNKPSKDTTSPFSTPHSKESISCTDIPVTHQGQNLQCGYHSLRNALIASEYARTKATINPKDMRFKADNNKEIIEAEPWKNLLPAWQEKIVKYRKKRILSALIQEQIKPYIVQPENKKIKTSTLDWLLEKLPWFKKEQKTDLYNDYRSILFNVAQGLANSIIEDETIETNYTYNDLEKLIDNAISHNNKKEALKNQFATYLPNIKNLTISIKATKIETELNKKYENKTENLDGDEIKHLLQETSNLPFLKENVTIVDDIKVAEYQENFNRAAQNWQNNDNSTHLFLIGTMNQDYRNSSGHWYMVATQKNNGQKTVFTADSLNIDRTNDQRVKTLIEKLDNYKNSK